MTTFYLYTHIFPWTSVLIQLAKNTNSPSIEFLYTGTTTKIIPQFILLLSKTFLEIKYYRELSGQINFLIYHCLYIMEFQVEDIEVVKRASNLSLT